jgi:uncharacterized protein YkwD
MNEVALSTRTWTLSAKCFLPGLLIWLLHVSCHAQRGSIAEQYLLSALNAERVSHHLRPVHTDSALHQAALLHAQQMADHGSISHRFSGEPELSQRGADAGGRFDLITENVAEGPTAVILHDAWMHSAGHRANILDPAVDAVGIAVVIRNGQLYAVQDFERSVESMSLEQQEAAIGVMLDAEGLELLPGIDARGTCLMTNGYAGEEQPSFVVRYTTADLTRLPSQLKEHLLRGHERRAAVGACISDEKRSFTSYNLAILLYR